MLLLETLNIAKAQLWWTVAWSHCARGDAQQALVHKVLAYIQQDAYCGMVSADKSVILCAVHITAVLWFEISFGRPPLLSGIAQQGRPEL